MYFAVVEFFTSQTLLFTLALAILSYGSSSFSSTISNLFYRKNSFFSVVLAMWRIGKMIKRDLYIKHETITLKCSITSAQLKFFSVQPKKAQGELKTKKKLLFECFLYLVPIFGINMFVESYQIASYHIIITVFI